MPKSKSKSELDGEGESVPRRKRGAPIPVIAQFPKLRGLTITSVKQLYELIDTEFPDMKKRKDFDQLIQRASDYLQLLDALGGQRELRRVDLYPYADSLGINRSKAVSLMFQEYAPRLFSLIKEAVSLSEFRAIQRAHKERLGEIRSVEDVISRIRGTPKERYLNSKMAKQWIKEAEYFFKLLNTETSGTIKGIAKSKTINEHQVRHFVNGALPRLVVLGLAESLETFETPIYIIEPFVKFIEGYGGVKELENIFSPRLVALLMTLKALYDSKSNAPSSKKQDTDTERKMFPVNIWQPSVDEETITSVHQLRNLVNARRPDFFDKPQGEQMLYQAEVQLLLAQIFGNVEQVPRGTFAGIASLMGLTKYIINNWLQYGDRPEIYVKAFGVDSRRRAETVSEIFKALNGIDSLETIKKRLSTVYAFSIMNTEREKQQWQRASRFFETLKEYLRGGPIEAVEQRTGLTVALDLWKKGRGAPSLVRFASLVPQDRPPIGMKWLPLHRPNTRYPDRFIAVPEEFHSPADYLHVLAQLVPPQRYEQKAKKFSNEINAGKHAPVGLLSLLRVFELAVDKEKGKVAPEDNTESWKTFYAHRTSEIRQLLSRLKFIDSTAELRRRLESIHSYESGEIVSSKEHWANVSRFFKAIEVYLLGGNVEATKRIAGRAFTRTHLDDSAPLPYLLKYALRRDLV
ncbi:MAG: hypothetical protein K9W43_03285 [Candidatus Thorarchaeota archaeon]|nr:hypothetical protein [Candidatus Thorarchaeota archaeon]